MNTLFEEFIWRTVKRALSGTNLRVDLQGPHGYALIDQRTNARRFATRPDVVISRDREPLLVIDTKWKRLKGSIDDPAQGVGQADVYQMMAYAHVYDCERLILLYPHHHALAEQEGMLAIHQIANKVDTLVGIATVGLAEPKKVRSLLQSLLLNSGSPFDLTAPHV